MGGTASSGIDFSGITTSPLFIAAGKTAATITGTLLSDPGASKTLTFTLGKPTNAKLGTITVNTLSITELTTGTDITIEHNVTTTGGAFALSGSTEVFTPTAAAAIINDADINAFLNSGLNVTINTASTFTNPGNITLDADALVQKTAGTSLDMLTLNALNNIAIDGDISGSTNPLTPSCWQPDPTPKTPLRP